MSYRNIRARQTAKSEGPVTLWGLLRVINIGRFYLTLPICQWHDDTWEDDDEEWDFWRLYETVTFWLMRDKPTPRKPTRPCYYSFKYDGRPHYVFAGFGLQLQIVRWYEPRPLKKPSKS